MGPCQDTFQSLLELIILYSQMIIQCRFDSKYFGNNLKPLFRILNFVFHSKYQQDRLHPGNNQTNLLFICLDKLYILPVLKAIQAYS